MSSDTPDPNSKPLLSRIISRIKSRIYPFGDTCDARTYQTLDTSRKDMIKGILDLSRHNARDIMVPRVDIVSVEDNTELKPLIKIIMEEGHSRLPVYEETIDNIVGILYVKDLLNFLTDKNRKFSLKKILHAPFFVPETMRVDELLLEFKKRKLHLAIVVDEYGGVAGIVTLEDILEEIVGDIEDEFDTGTEPEWEKKGDNVYEVDSRMTIDDFNEELGLKLSTDEFDTIGGYVLDLFGRIPVKNEVIEDRMLSFKILDITGTIINRIEVNILKNRP